MTSIHDRIFPDGNLRFFCLLVLQRRSLNGSVLIYLCYDGGMLIDGKAIAKEIEVRLTNICATFLVKPTLAIVLVGDDPVIESFVRIKKMVGARIGVSVVEHRFPKEVSGEELIRAISLLSADDAVNGIIIQLPLPTTIDVQAVLNAVPLSKDVDVLASDSVAAFRQGSAKVLPPVAGAIQEILECAHVDVSGKEALVLGHGRLVGAPAALLLRHNNAHVTVIDKPVTDLVTHVCESDIVITGVGSPGMITPQMLREGAVLIDAGTSEAGGKIVGDADPRCADVASVFTPVPGGVGPLTVVMLFKNLLALTRAGEGIV